MQEILKFKKIIFYLHIWFFNELLFHLTWSLVKSNINKRLSSMARWKILWTYKLKCKKNLYENEKVTVETGWKVKLGEMVRIIETGKWRHVQDKGSTRVRVRTSQRKMKVKGEEGRSRENGNNIFFHKIWSSEFSGNSQIIIWEYSDNYLLILR